MTDSDGDTLIQRISDPGRTSDERSADAYELLQEVFRGYPASKLITLLRSDDSGAVVAGVWVLSELGSTAVPLVDEVESILGSPSPKARYWAIDVVHSSAGSEDGRIIGKALELLEDADIAVRRAALYFLARASESQLSAAIPQLGDSKIGRLVGWLFGKAFDRSIDVSDIVNRLRSDDRLVRMVAAAAAARISGRDRTAIERAAGMDDDDISVFASRELERWHP